MAGTPVSTPIDLEKDNWEDRETWSFDPEIDLACRNYIKQHRECPHGDDDAYLPRELNFFKEQDVIIRNSHGTLIASLRSPMEVKISSVYRWIAIGFGIADGWGIVDTTTGLVMDRTDASHIRSGDYTLTGKEA